MAPLLALLALAGPAEAATITGRLTGTDGTPLARARVYLSNKRTTRTNADGMWRIGNLRPGFYLAYFDASHLGYIPDLTSKSIRVPRLRSVVRLTKRLQPGATISGRVLDAAGDPIAGIRVNEGTYFEYPAPRGSYWYDGRERAVTDSQGRYRLRGLTSGAHTIFFDGRKSGFVSEYYGGHPCSPWGSSPMCQPDDEVTVTAPHEVSGVDVALKRGGFIRGRVSGAGQPLRGVKVTVVRVPGMGRKDRAVYTMTASTGDDGRYEAGPLLAGPHRVHFDGEGLGWIPETYDDREPGHWTESPAPWGDPVVVAEGATSRGVDADLVRGGTVSGRVVDESGPLAKALVSVDSRDGHTYRAIRTDPRGRYEVPGLRSGDYTVAVRGPSGQGYEQETYPDQVPPLFCKDEPVRVAAPHETTGINVRLKHKGSIRGRVTAGGAPLAGALVQSRYLEEESLWYHEDPPVRAVTGEDGRYLLENLSRGRYQIVFSHPDHAPEWYPNQPHRESAGTVFVASGADVAGVDAELEEGGAIAGTVTDEQGRPWEGVVVLTGDFGCTPGTYNLRHALTDAEGRYLLAHVAPGSHPVQFRPQQYNDPRLWEWYDDVPLEPPAADDPWDDCRDAPPPGITRVPVEAGEVTGGVDARMQHRGSIAGSVTIDGTPPGEGRYSVRLYDERGVPLSADGAAVADSSGHYEHPAAPGRYHLEVAVGVGEWPDSYVVRTFYPGVRTREGATLIEVQAGQATLGVDVDVAMGGSVSGVIGGAGTEARVYALDADKCRTAGPSGNPYSASWDCGHSVRTAKVAADGSYRFEDLSGRFKIGVCRGGCGGVPVPNLQWYEGWSFAQARTLEVHPGESVEGIDMVANDQAGAIIGQLRYPTPEGPYTCPEHVLDYPEAELHLFRADGIPMTSTDSYFLRRHGWYGGMRVDAFDFALHDIPAGDYKLQFVPDPPWLPEFYDNKPDLASADIIHLEAGSWVPGVDAVFERAP